MCIIVFPIFYFQVALICDHFRVILERAGCDTGVLQGQEWPAFKIYATRMRALKTTDLLERVLTNEGLKMRFPNLGLLFKLYLCIPSSSAVCERGFSAMKRIKSDWRTSLQPEMMDRLMAISVSGPPVDRYEAGRAVQMWLHGGERRRRFQGLVVDNDSDDE